MFIFVLIVLAGFTWYVMSPEERARLVRRASGAVRYSTAAAVRVHSVHGDFQDALRARTQWPIATPILIFLNLALFGQMVFGEGSLSDPETLVAWGASIGPRTTNGEWWRLLTASFVHSGPLHLLANMAGLALLGVLLERLLGHAAFVTVYVASAVFSNLGSLSAAPMTVTCGATGAIFGLFGLLAAAAAWGFVERPRLRIPLDAFRALAPSLAVFLAYTAASSGLTSAAAMNGLVMGLVCGAGLARGVAVRKPPALRSAAAVGAALVVSIASAVSIGGFIDVKPEIARVLALEARTSGAYEKAVEQFRLGAMSAEALAAIIDHTILPDVRSVSSRIDTLERVPAGDQSLVAGAREYLRLRAESWRLRVEGLQTHNMPMLQRADRTEWASLNVLDQIKSERQ